MTAPGVAGGQQHLGLGGSVNLSAGGSYSQIASNVVAAQDITITATSIELLTADEIGHSSGVR